MRLIVYITSLLLVSKLKLTSPCYSPYLNAFPSIIVPAKKPAKQLAKQPAKLTLVILTLLASLAGSTCSISNTLAYLYTTSVAPKASAANKRRKPSSPPPLGPPKPSQRAKLIKVTQITCIEPPIDHSQHIQFQNGEIKEVKEAIPYQVLEGHSYYRHYYNKTKEEVKVRKERRRYKLYTKQQRNIKRLKGLNLKVLLHLKRINLGPYSLDLINQDNKDFNIKDMLERQAEDLY